jgi:hypothetical protein
MSLSTLCVLPALPERDAAVDELVDIVRTTYPETVANKRVLIFAEIDSSALIRGDVPALKRDRLSWVDQNYLRDDTLTAANTMKPTTGTQLGIRTQY